MSKKNGKGEAEIDFELTVRVIRELTTTIRSSSREAAEKAAFAECAVAGEVVSSEVIHCEVEA